ncbi:MAG TPA: hypothetical protein VNZ52_12820, partial [Candidatus Thermoplasmatota archaeon]|nr:hypothetical protein [Candidatus Thermoplasmatota archaeon]
MASKSAILTTGLVALCMLLTTIPAVGAHHDGTNHDVNTDRCLRQGTAWAAISNVEAAGVTLQTQVGGQNLQLPRGLLAAAVSTTGTLDVTVKHECVKHYVLTATVTSQQNGVNTYTYNAFPGCVGGADTYNVPVGMDVAHVSLDLVWYGCDGTSGKDHRDVDVVD